MKKYLNPVPDFEVFQLASTDGHPFVVFMIPKQKQRRILAKVSSDVCETANLSCSLEKATCGPKARPPESEWRNLRIGMRSTKKLSNAKRSKGQRETAHSLDLALAREKIRVSAGSVALPSYFTDDEFQALMEDLCANQNQAKFNLLLERLRDELIEAWEKVGAYDHGAPTLPDKVKDHIKNIFRPNMHWLTLAGLYVVKNSGPPRFLEAVIALLRELFESWACTTLRVRPGGRTVS